MLEQPILRPKIFTDKTEEDLYELVEDYVYEKDGVKIRVPKGFLYNGASIPASAWQLIYSPYNPNVMAPSLVHDWLYKNHQVSREEADNIFEELLKENYIGKAKCIAIYRAVQVFGVSHWDRDEDDADYLTNLAKSVKDSPYFDEYKFPDRILEQLN